jgi:hypothetical protein
MPGGGGGSREEERVVQREGCGSTQKGGKGSFLHADLAEAIVQREAVFSCPFFLDTVPGWWTRERLNGNVGCGPHLSPPKYGRDGAVSDGRLPLTTYSHFYRSRDKVEYLHYSISGLVEGYHG